MIDLVQGLGRALRLLVGVKEYGVVILPVCVDAEGSLANVAFNTAATVLKALKDEDEAIREELEALYENRGVNRPGVRRRIVRMGEITLTGLTDAIGLRLISNVLGREDLSSDLIAKWRIVEAFVAKHGRDPKWKNGVTKPDCPEEAAAVNALDEIKKAKRDGKLPAELVEPCRDVVAARRQNRTTTCWRINWDDAMSYIRAFHAANGKLPRNNRADPDERRMAQWIEKRKKDFKAGKLDPVIENELRSMGWVPELTNVEANRKKAQDPEYRKRQAEAARKTAQDPEWRKRHVEARRAEVAANAPYRTHWRQIKATHPGVKPPNPRAKPETWKAFIEGLGGLTSTGSGA